TTYPNGFKIQREYHAAGYQTKTTDVTNSASPKVLWTLGNAIDTRGNFNRQLWGNGVVTQTEFDNTSGYLSSIKSGRLSGANQVTNLYGDIQNLSYTFDSLGNLYSRTTARINNSGAVQETITENFAYDKLNRLTHSTTSGLFGRTQTYQYDTGGLGNLVNRTDTLTGSSVNNDVGTLAYDRVRNAGIHAVTSAGGINYSYDRYGNMIVRGSETLTYDVFNKPTRIAGSTTTDFFYGPDHELYKQVSGGVTTYKLAGGVYEVTTSGTTTTQKSYVDGVILNTRTLVNGTQTANDTQYLHGDHLGSTEAITNALGQFVSRMSFSTWGERQKADWKPGPLTSTELITYNAITTNGYTGHDQLDNHNLIHMGGRIYDPNLGRFLSADLFIQSPYNTQSFNRYSYTFNNPLSYTDPSGYLNNKSGKSPFQQDFNHRFQQAISEVLVEGSRRDQQLAHFAAAATNSNNQMMFSAIDAQAFVNSLVGQGVTELIYSENGETYKMSIDAKAFNDSTKEVAASVAVGVGVLAGAKDAGSSIKGLLGGVRVGNPWTLLALALTPTKMGDGTLTGNGIRERSKPNIVVIGEGQLRVTAFAKSINAEYFRLPASLLDPSLNPSAELLKKTLAYNIGWINEKMDNGYIIYDLGRDGRSVPSAFYSAEIAEINARQYPYHYGVRLKE
ncbi:RHS repeat domain-containing protein, partial [Cellvibrio sp. ARAG 10.3]|uniref:RHS repeat domain-containing protein n=1 Tax=Cellvibrio sp. ARAG 10.3 TaxID=3451358 RepID=UPI003F45D541